MICDIYRSDSKSGLYIYLKKGEELSCLPDDLLKLLGKHTWVMELDLKQRKKLANEDINTVIANLHEKAYHVQLPRNLLQNVINYH